MEIKETQGQTLLVLLRVAIFGLACLCVFGMRSAAESVFTLVEEGAAAAEESGEVTENVYGTPYVLYYDKDLNGAELHTYKYYYVSGKEGAYGLTDASGSVLLEQKYQGIFVLPDGYILKEDGKWRFYDKELALLSDEAWDTVQPALDENQKIRSDLVKVSRDGLFGATDMKGSVRISPRWDSLNIFNTYGWELMRVSKDGSFGFIDGDGDVAISVRYDYAQIGQLFHDEPDADPPSEPAIFLKDGDGWSCVHMDANGGPGWQEYGVIPGEEILSGYENYLASQN